MNKVICIKNYYKFDIHNIYECEQNSLYPGHHYVRHGKEIVGNGLIAVFGYLLFDDNEFNKYFISIKEYRNNKIDKILE